MGWFWGYSRVYILVKTGCFGGKSNWLYETTRLSYDLPRWKFGLAGLTGISVNVYQERCKKDEWQISQSG